MVHDLEIQNVDAILNPSLSGEMLALLAEFKLNLNNYLHELTSSPVRSLSGIIVFYKNNPHLVSHHRSPFIHSTHIVDLRYRLQTWLLLPSGARHTAPSSALRIITLSWDSSPLLASRVEQGLYQ